MESAISSVGIYLALNALIMIWFAKSTGELRRKHKILIGDGGNLHLIRTMRGHANAAENIPMFMLALLVAALMGMPTFGVHIFGIVFTVGRATHAYYFIKEDAPVIYRFAGFGIALVAMALLLLGLLTHGIWSLIV